MPIPSGVTKTVLSGSLPGGEIFQTAYWCTGLDPADNTDASTATEAGNTTFQTMLTTIAGLMNSSSHFTALDRYTYAGGSGAAAHGHATLTVGGSGSAPHPNQIAAVATLRTGTPGRSARGRMYLPANGALFAGSLGQVDATTMNGVIDAIAAWFTELASASTPVVVLSIKNGTHLPVTSVDGDYILDTQRRRRNAQTSSRHSTAI